MIRSEHILLLLAALSASQALPMGCSEDAHCPTGFYCELSRLFCQECLSCQLFKRLPPSVETACVANVNDCGACYDGLVSKGEECVEPPSGLQLPAYVWVAIGLGLVVCVAAAVVLTVLSNFPTFKILSCCMATRTTATVNSRQKPPEPDSPPPYDAVAGNTATTEATALEESSPFLTPTLATARESASVQQACVYSPPQYATASDHASDPGDDSSQRNTDDDQSDEAQEFSENEVVAEYAARDMATPTKPQDSNNNEEPSDARQSPSGGASGHLIQIININRINNINNITCGGSENELI